MFCTSVYNALEKGRRKKTNIHVIGPSNCGKSFLFRPLKKIFDTFVNPASNTFSLVKAVSSEVVFLNDFRWSEKILPWHDFLNLLEGESIHVSSPKTHYTEDLLWTKTQPIFCTGISEIVKICEGGLDENETEMMRNRWTVFRLRSVIDGAKIKEIDSCAKCFFELIDGFRVR